MTEVRVGLIEFGKALNASVTLPGLGELPGGQVSAGRAVRGARARLKRADRILADNLRLGIMVRKKFFSSDVEPVTDAGFLKDVFVAVGRTDLGPGDALELYTDDMVGPDTSRQLCMATVLAPAYDQLTGFHVQVRSERGVLRFGALTGLFRGGRPVGQPMRVLGLFGPAGPLPELPSGQLGTVLLGFQCDVPPMAGDALTAYEEPAHDHLERREGTAHVHGVTDLGNGSVVAAVEVPDGRTNNLLTVGTRARLLRPVGTTFNERSTVVATDLRILSVARGGVAMRTAAGTGVFTLGLATRDVRQNDIVETYVPVDAPVLAPPPVSAPLPVALVDVNTAAGPELARLPGMTPERVNEALEQRRRQGGFPDVEAFGVAAGLQPHEIVRLRGRATAGQAPVIAQRETGVRQLDI
ncbi:helix-hairpin-helix domain-containing protein [Amycolatopsis sp., V23-08]|uniref:Helix-hairpin-helix domain-containing protein n=1 Tax=Amycolatopsis heterodermiae TaxID=3110235 RepID=A0ABU5QYG1_9PSEU|nr:helix-hairpin-helix domain-containing protein [Amycolatopsis sp., V23-08]MEA5358981.1 helix-hairpin-helix domain-containing protein [Amycolatopsis sp., V23-08]